ncbi:MAG: TIGR04551 family protein [Deltaproteobacteria bacterium]|nr:TIGR04551 family protein [Deltaproteobacteria bacterium]
MKRKLSVIEVPAARLTAVLALVKAAIAPLTRAILACYAPDRTGSMRRFFAITGVVSLSVAALGATSAAAQGSIESTTQGARGAANTEEEEALSETEAASPEPSREEDLPPQLRAPTVEGLELPTAPPSTADSEEEFDESAFDEDAMTADDAKLLGMAEPPASDPTLASWTNPLPVFSLAGYFRVRGNYIDNFSVRRIPLGPPLEPSGRLTGDPFARWIPVDNSPSTGGNGVLPAGGCKGEPSARAGAAQRCDGSATLRYANMRLRLQPTLSLSDNIRVHMMLDIFDNLVLGSTPDVKTVNRLGQIPGRVPGVPFDTLTQTLPPPESFRNTVGDNIYVRRAWGEVTNSTIGQLRFGRMGHQWGLGMLWNAGVGTNPLDTVLDSDFQSEIDRIQLIGKFKGIFFGVSWDFASKGYIFDPVSEIQAIAIDASRLDDTRQWSFLVARRMDPLAQEKRLARGKWVINGGAYFIYRSQFLSTASAPLLGTISDVENAFVRRDARVYIPDGWLQVLWKDLRLEIEFAGVFGQVQNIAPAEFPPAAEGAKFKLRQWGIAFEGEYRFLGKKLGVFLKGGVASGDPDVVGLSQYEDLATQPVGQKTVSNFAFHPDYRVDLILWRRIMGRIGGAYYLAPAISYDIIRTDFGRVVGARLDFIYSRAMYQQQTYSSEPNLGAEIDIAIYYRTEDGPKFTDGFFAAAEFGILFPLNGLRYLEVDGVREPGTEGLDISRALTLRLILGIEF